MFFRNMEQIDKLIVETLNNITTEISEHYPQEYEVHVRQSSLEDQLARNNVTEIDDIPLFLQSMVWCGNMIDLYLNSTSVAATLKQVENIDTAVSFNWIKCPANYTSQYRFGTTETGTLNPLPEVFRPSTPPKGHQEAAATKRWVDQYNIIFAQNYSSYQKYPNMTRNMAREQALFDALDFADGFEGCIADVPAAAWWWFIMMAVVGRSPPGLFLS